MITTKQIYKTTFSLLLILAMLTSVFASIKNCCDNSKNKSCSEKGISTTKIVKTCNFCDIQFTAICLTYSNIQVSFIQQIFIKIKNQPILSVYNHLHSLNKKLRAPPIYS